MLEFLCDIPISRVQVLFITDPTLLESQASASILVFSYANSKHFYSLNEFVDVIAGFESFNLAEEEDEEANVEIINGDADDEYEDEVVEDGFGDEEEDEDAEEEA